MIAASDFCNHLIVMLLIAINTFRLTPFKNVHTKKSNMYIYPPNYEINTIYKCYIVMVYGYNY